jgi:hypothetical protein
MLSPVSWSATSCPRPGPRAQRWSVERLGLLELLTVEADRYSTGLLPEQLAELLGWVLASSPIVKLPTG